MLKKESSSELLLLEMLNDLCSIRKRVDACERNIRVLMERVCNNAVREVENENEN